ncbi:MAG: hypothetical protein CMB99_08665 [Flavobacteriaceae bacterium]|nr:hypothetical protein [Flavobacteriaceae bacterium]|tara:strand:- start:9392 stop:15181 length:5790 start_codon:yes stop_codon:yes gene_type:complete
MRKNYILALVLATFGMQFYAFPSEEGNRDNLASKKTNDLPVTYTVTNTSDDVGTANSLRWAIDQANNNPGADVIHFAIGTGAATINIGSEIQVDETVTISGDTQPGFTTTPLITLVGDYVFSFENGSDNSEVTWLAFESTTSNTGIAINTVIASDLSINENTFYNFQEAMRLTVTSGTSITNNTVTGTTNHALRFLPSGNSGNTNNTIDNNNFSGTASNTIHFQSGANSSNTITNNDLTNSGGWAIFYSSGTPTSITNNDLTGSDSGIYITGANTFELTSPTSTGANKNTWGDHTGVVFRFELSTNITIDDWTMAPLYANGVNLSLKNGLWVKALSNSTIENNDVSGGFGVGLRMDGVHPTYNSNNTIRNNNLSGTTSRGFYSAGGNGNTIIGNNLTNGGDWAIEYKGTPAQISGNDFTGSSSGVYLLNTDGFNLTSPTGTGSNQNTWGDHQDLVLRIALGNNLTIKDWVMAPLFANGVNLGTKYGLHVLALSNSTIEDNDFSGGFANALRMDGIHPTYNTNNIIRNNNLSGSTSRGFFTAGGSGESITGNDFTNGGDWAIEYKGTPVEISGNDFTGSASGVYLFNTNGFNLTSPTGTGPNQNTWGDHQDLVLKISLGTNLTIKDWVMAPLFASGVNLGSKYGLHVLALSNSTIEDNDLSGGFGTALRMDGVHPTYNTNNTIRNNNFSGTTGNGIYSAGGSANTFTNNNLTNSGVFGLEYFGTEGQISGNDFSGSSNGIHIRNSNSNFTLGANTFANHAGTSIAITASSNVTIQNVDLTNAASNANFDRGIYINAGSNIVIDNVQICNRDYGIEFISSGTNNQIINSKISNSSTAGIKIPATYSNTTIDNVELAGNTTDISDNGTNTVSTNLNGLAQSYWCPGDPPIDQTAPVITLLGDNPQNIDFTDAYVEANATALDDTDGDLTANITIDASAVNVNVIGSYSVTYEVTDAAGNTGTATRTVNVNNVPEPTIFGLTTSVIQNSVNNVFDVLANDNFGTNGPNATHPLTLQNGTLNNASDQGGIVSVEDNGTPNDLTDDVIHYSPPKDYNGPDFITYTITDSKGLAKTGTINITVTPLATVSTPTANDDTATVDQASSDNIINVLANDEPGLDGYINGGLTMTNGTLVSASAKGAAISIDNKNTDDTTDDVFLYTPPVGFSGTDTFQYTITDGSGDASTATVNVTVNAVNVGYQPDSATVDQNSSDNIIDVMANDPDDATFGSNDTRFLIESVDHLTGTTAKGGTVALETYNTADTADDVILYTPRAGFTGTDTFNYVPGNNRNSLVPVTVTVTEVVVVNGSPSATDDVASATQGGNTITIDVLDNDDYGSDGPNATHQLTFSNGSTSNASANGAAITVVNNEIEYTPTATFSGTDTFTYVITDADGEADSATVTVTVTSGGATAFVPDAVDDVATVSINNGATVIDVLANDEPGADGYIDGGLTMTNGTLSSASTKGGAISIDNKGTGTVSDDEFSYTPPAGFSGTDTFQYTITDNSGDADTATVTITVVASATPTAVDDAFSVIEDSGANAINVLSNDLAGANPPITVVSYDALGANGGSVVLNGDGTGTYTPPTSFTGTDTFEYTISTSGGSDTGTVTITITTAAAVNSTPTANDDIVASGVTQGGSSVDIDVTDNDDYGTDGPNAKHPLTFTNGAITNASSNGAALEVVNGQIRYTPTATFSGTDTFTYVITDEDGEADRATVTITVASNGSGGGGGGGTVSTPTAVDDSFTVNQNSSANSVHVLNNDTIGSDGYISGHGLRLQGGLSERFTDNGGFLKVNDFGTPNDASDDRIEYTPVNGFSGTETFVYTITDATGDASTATVTMTVNAIPKIKSTETSDFTNSFSVYPNPSNGLVRTAIESATSGKANVYLMDVTGKIIYKSEVNLVKGKNNLDFNFNVSQGVMFLKIIGNSNYGIQKVIFK